MSPMKELPEDSAPQRLLRKKLPDSRPGKPTPEIEEKKKKPANRKPATMTPPRKSKPSLKKPMMARPKGIKNKPPPKRNKNAKRTTAQDLLAACQEDKIPTNEQVKADYGFSRCYITVDQSKLMAVYRTVLVDFEVKPAELHAWLQKGGLKKVAAEIKDKMEAMLGTEEYRGDYNFFLEHQYIWDPEDLESEAKAARAAKEMREYYAARQRPGQDFDWYS
ncbi:hypothetical protein CORC01_12197 [Colletotrichum orchidophilum]|uniref:Uncharacterized protein n=1 Tax=Colletotrichum orchidophilum TaxID=1209926 RepID=A0A1G4ATH7_9PEZI|nr:uncharacterized protein CORC01_12197 [Colletotrichum orchidophilum]OHE92479.1 hypothetical protein CORC01_12197 [Colletotrichum orchidophilum]